MLFNSIQFLLFFPAVCVIYFCIPAGRVRLRNAFLLLASYYFYMNWEPAYALLLLGSTAITYLCALGMAGCHSSRPRKTFLWAGIMLNLLVLFLFKYYGFASELAESLLSAAGLRHSFPRFGLLLPVGISFYVFQALGYTADVYRGQVRAERDFLTYALFVSFFPQLVAGPIERSARMLPQFAEAHRPDYGRMLSGARLMAWGYFTKLVVADRCGLYVDAVFNHVSMHNGGDCLLASLLFPFQIYGDFAGYSLIAIGTARVLGFRLCENFRRPYFASSVGEFWHRWHVSLSTWFRDYVYIPLGGNRAGRTRQYANLMVTFLLSGLWHGASLTFVAWGGLHGLLLCIEKALGVGDGRRRQRWLLPRRLLTFVLVALLWVPFRAATLGDAWLVVERMVGSPSLPDLSFAMFTEVTAAMAAIGVLMLREVADERGWRPSFLRRHPAAFTHAYIVVLACTILLLGVLGGDQFIYFQF